jgi:hypothetical protein
MKQLQIQFTEPIQTYSASQMKFGQVFQYGADKRVMMRVKPVNYLTNSTLVTDCINRNKVFVIGLDKGTLFVIEGNAEVVPLNATLSVSKEPV